MAKSYSSLNEIKADLLKGNTTVEKLVKYYLENIKKNAHLNVFNEVFDAESLQRAKEIDSKIKAGVDGKLAGMVVAIKDNISYKDHKVSASSKILDGFTGCAVNTSLMVFSFPKKTFMYLLVERWCE